MVVFATAVGFLCTAGAVLAEEKVNLGVAVPAATAGWTGGVVYWANQAKKDLEKAHPGLKITVKTAGSVSEQANQLQDLLTVTKIDTLVILPFESASLTKPVAQLRTRAST
jgi:ribose transport system substrate-binding protein